jgi:predicted ATPase
MNAGQTNWYVITGGPSSGKTTTIGLLKSRGYSTAPEMARTLIEEGQAQGRTLAEIRADGDAFQLAILHRQVALEAALNPDDVVFLDRGMPDGLAYERFLGLVPNPELVAASASARYRKVFVLDLLPIEDDGGRPENEDEQSQIQEHLLATYRELGFDVETVPVMSPGERAQHILDRLS